MAKKEFKMDVMLRDPKEYERERTGDIRRVFRTQETKHHKFQQAREYTRAVTATKLDNMFSKPFLHAFSSHTDGIYTLAKIPNALPYILAGDGEGVVKLWHLGIQKELWTANAHQGRVRGLASSPNGEYALSCSADKTIKMWTINQRDESMDMSQSHGQIDQHVLQAEPKQVYVSTGLFNGIDHHRKKPLFVTAGNSVDVWDISRHDPIHSFQWGADGVSSVKCNNIDHDVIASTGSDRSVILYDIRTKSPIRKLTLFHGSNALAWNPMEAYHFVIGSEDSNLYTFDMRNLQSAITVHREHVNAVLSVDYSPTGKEFVSGSYDKTVRIWDYDQAKSKDCYHTKRMQHVYSVQFSQDTRYILTGSDDANIRLWKAHANEKLGVVAPREQAALQYRDKLKEKYSKMGDVHRISHAQRIPKAIRLQQHERDIKRLSRQRKLTNMSAHKGRTIKDKNLKVSRIIKEHE